MSGRLRIGPAGWSYEDWKGIVYPRGMPKGQHPLTYLAQFFDTVEVNSTFYRPPVADYCASWASKVSDYPEFKFCAKLWEGFTHKRGRWPSDGEIAQIFEGFAPLHDAGKLGAILVQFPWSFKRTNENRLWMARVLDTFEQFSLAVELRHASWDLDEVYMGFKDRGIAFCNIDQPLFKDSIEPSATVTGRMAYVRLHGRNYDNWFREDAGRDDRYNYLYSEEELEPWIAKINGMRNEVDEVYVITNNHYRGQAVVNALELGNALDGRTYTLPQHILDEYPRLKRLLT